MNKKKTELLIIHNYNADPPTTVNIELEPKEKEAIISYIESLKYQKPEVLKVGTRVEILESARDALRNSDFKEFKEDLIGTIQEIEFIYDNTAGIYYGVSGFDLLPHYCVKPVDEEKPEDKRPEPDTEGRSMADIMVSIESKLDRILSKLR